MELPLRRLAHLSLSRLNVVPHESRDGRFVIMSEKHIGLLFTAEL